MRATLLLIVLICCGCASTQHLQVETSRFPVPIMQKAPVHLGIYLDKELTSFVHKESIDKKGDFEVAVGTAQRQLFLNLASGVFAGYEFVDGPVAAHLDGVLQPTITELQFSLPSQTRSDYYEIWIRYQFKLFDSAGNLVGEWKLPAYGKANKNDHGSKSVGLEEAALAACRDAMAFFSINFDREPVVKNWLAAGKPLVPASSAQAVTTAATPAAAAPAASAVAAANPATTVESTDAGQQKDATADGEVETGQGESAITTQDEPVSQIDSIGDAAGGSR